MTVVCMELILSTALVPTLTAAINQNLILVVPFIYQINQTGLHSLRISLAFYAVTIDLVRPNARKWNM